MFSGISRLGRDGGYLAIPFIRILVVDDFEPWRRFYCSTLQKQRKFQVVGEVSDGLEAVHQARQLQPDLILLDIGLPTLNGIEAARQIREVSAASKIIFVSENRSADIVEEALSTGASGYVVKSDAGRELLSAVNAVLEGKRFVSHSLAGYGLNGPPNQHNGQSSSVRQCCDIHPAREHGRHSAPRGRVLFRGSALFR